MKYLFLDVDGVLNHEQWYEKIHNHPELCPGPFPLECFDPDCVKMVNEILERTGSKLVISSSWRLDKYLSETFVKVGLPQNYMVTPCLESKSHCRGNEIQMFLNEHPYDNYVILDDVNDMLVSQKDHFIWTCAGFERYGDMERIKENGGTGLTEKLKERTIELLKKGDE